MQTPLPAPTTGPLQVYQAQDGSMWAVNPSSGFGLQIAPPGGSVTPGAGGVSEAPTDGQLYGRQSAGWAPVPAQGESLYSEEWRWTTTVTPSNGQVTLDGAPDWASAVKLDLSTNTTAGRDMTPAFSELFSVGNDVYVQVKGSSANAATYTIAGAGINNASWWQFPLTFKSSSGTLPPNNSAVDVTVFVKGAGGASNAVQKSGDTMTGTLLINTVDGSGTLTVKDGSLGVGYEQSATLKGTELDFIPYSGNGQRMTLMRATDGGMTSLSIQMGGGAANPAIMLGAGQPDVNVFYTDQTTGDLIVKGLYGPNAGKSVNLTAGKWA